MADRDDAAATVELAAQLVRVPSVNPPGDGEGEVAELLRAQLDAAGLRTEIVVSPASRPSLVAHLGEPTGRPPLVLLSHTDVVPVEPDAWSQDPFGGEVIDGHLWGRGTLDMKGVAALHARAAIALAQHADRLTRELIVVAVSDEEAGGGEGAEWLVRERGELVGLTDDAPPPEVLGEGAFGLSGVVPRPLMPIVVGEKSTLGVRARVTGAPGHASLPPRDQAIHTLTRFVDRVAGPRAARVHPVMKEQFGLVADAARGAQRRLFQLLAGPAGPSVVRAAARPLRDGSAAVSLLLSDTITPTRIQGGYKINVVPGSAEATFDCRLLPDTDPDEVLAWLHRAGRGRVEIEQVHRWGGPVSGRGPLFALLAEVSGAMPSRPLPVPSLTPGLTDLRFFRARGATAYGWVPVVLSPELVSTFHGHDERVPVDQLANAQAAMDELLRRACTAPG